MPTVDVRNMQGEVVGQIELRWRLGISAMNMCAPAVVALWPQFVAVPMYKSALSPRRRQEAWKQKPVAPAWKASFPQGRVSTVLVHPQ